MKPWSDATAQGSAAGTGPAAAADGGNPSVASADAAAAASASAYATAAAGPSSHKVQPPTATAGMEKHFQHRQFIMRVFDNVETVSRGEEQWQKLVVENQGGRVRDERRIGGYIGRS